MQDQRSRRVGATANDGVGPVATGRVTVLRDRQTVRGRATPGGGAGRRHNLPASLISFVGREQDLAQIARLLDDHRLVTLYGAPGVGKTRLALRVAGEVLPAFEDGVWLVELAALAEPTLVPAAVASALGVRHEGRHPLVEVLVERFRGAELLLLLDNCEHLLDACATLANTLLSACPGLWILATSREPLRLTGEVSWSVPSLSVPASDEPPGSSPPPRDPASTVEAVLASEAGRLFLERALAVRPAFELSEIAASGVAQICRRLDGIPLAVELAAARVRALTAEQLATRLDDRFLLLTSGSRAGLPRQRTLRALIDWSYDLLSEPERILLRRLAVFAGGWTLEAAEAVAADERPATDGERNGQASSPVLRPLSVLDLLSQLVEKSLVTVDDRPGEARYRLLEVIRQYGEERLVEAGEADALRRRHSAWFLALAERAWPELWGPDEVAWLRRLDAEHDNLRTALAWCRAVEEDEAGLRLAWALMRYWDQRGYYAEGRAHLARALAIAPGPSEARARALSVAGFLALEQGDSSQARAMLEEGLALARALGDPFTLGMSLVLLGAVLINVGELRRAVTLLEESAPLSRAVGEEAHAYILDILSLFWRANVARVQADERRAGELLEAGLNRAREHGARSVTCHFLQRLGQLAIHRADYEQAAALQRESLVVFDELADPLGIMLSLTGLACVAGAQGRAERATRLLGAAEVLRDRLSFVLLRQFRADHERARDTARVRLGEAAFAVAWAEGRAMPLSQAVAYALEAASPAPTPAVTAEGISRLADEPTT
jgi:predicted ATPase